MCIRDRLYVDETEFYRELPEVQSFISFNEDNIDEYYTREAVSYTHLISDVKVTERAATSYLTMLYKKLEPLILTKNNSNNSSYENKYHKDFGKLVTALTKLEA